MSESRPGVDSLPQPASLPAAADQPKSADTPSAVPPERLNTDRLAELAGVPREPEQHDLTAVSTDRADQSGPSGRQATPRHRDWLQPELIFRVVVIIILSTAASVFPKAALWVLFAIGVTIAAVVGCTAIMMLPIALLYILMGVVLLLVKMFKWAAGLFKSGKTGALDHPAAETAVDENACSSEHEDVPPDAVDEGGTDEKSEVERRRRRQARVLLDADRSRAGDLLVGRPDLPRYHDDGGLVDINNVDADFLRTVSWLDPDHAGRIVAARGRSGGFLSLAHLSLEADLPWDLQERLAEYLIFIQ